MYTSPILAVSKQTTSVLCYVASLGFIQYLYRCACTHKIEKSNVSWNKMNEAIVGTDLVECCSICSCIPSLKDSDSLSPLSPVVAACNEETDNATYY